MDCRDRAREWKPGWVIDEGRQVLVLTEETLGLILESMEGEGGDVSGIDEVTFPFKYVVCPTCEGKGKHVNPDIDRNGITQDEMEGDPDFREEYCSGIYDVVCYGCGGNRVTPEIDTDRLTDTKWLLALEALWEADARYSRECESERRMGA